MAATDRVAFYRTNVTFTPTGGNATLIKTASLSLNEEVAEADATTTEDNGYAFTVMTLAKITGSMRLYHREGEDLPVKARDRGNLTWNVNTTNPANGNYTVAVQFGTISRGEADVNGVVPCTINFTGQGGWANGSFGA
jgi:hypothetical protein